MENQLHRGITTGPRLLDQVREAIRLKLAKPVLV